MVSNSLHMELDELVAALTRIRAEHAADPDYLAVRQDLPENWPM